MQPAIQVNDLHIRYRQRRQQIAAVCGLSFQVGVGEVVGFLGPNGAGKSSTIKALMGFVKPNLGSIQVFGAPAGEPKSKAQIGYLPEVALYYPYLTPVETLTMFGELQGLWGKTLRAEIDRLLEIVGLHQIQGKQNRNLSKGMLQRVGIAQALLGNPSLLILDEMTSGLDPIGRQELRQLLQEKREQGTTMFFSSHELAEVEMLCDRLLVVHQGQLVDERDLNSLMTGLRRYELTFRGPADITALAVSQESVESGVTLAKFADKTNLMKAVETLGSSRAAIVDITAQEGSLEDYFVETIRRAA